MLNEQITIDPETNKKIVSVRSDTNEFEITSTYNDDGSLYEVWIFESDSYYVNCSMNYDSKGELKSKNVFTYDDKGLVSSWTVYDKNGNLVEER